MTEDVSPSLSLHAGWTLRQPERGIKLPVTVPFDVHSTLIAAGVIDDPYWRDNELTLDWVHESEWLLSREFDIPAPYASGNWTLCLDNIDCITTVTVNGRTAGQTASQFVRHDLNITQLLRPGSNHIEICFHSNSLQAAEAARRFPFELPYLEWNCRIAHTNHLRKSACHAGWDWNIALMPLGIYGDARLRRTAVSRLDDIKFVQHHDNGQVRVSVTAYALGFAVAQTTFKVSLCGHEIEHTVRILPGDNSMSVDIDIKSPELWWPAGHGSQTLHVLTVQLGTDQIRRNVGLRQIELLTYPDDVGARFAIAVNGREIFMRGANWIPADALPRRGSPEAVENGVEHGVEHVVEHLLLSARDANMNMLRVWGGGQYEADWFYELCDQLGILVWQDFMFSCNHYPAANHEWLQSVRLEARQQVRRLSTHACVALWCGDNELVGALNWFDVTRANRDRYLANYVILNHALEEVIQAEAVDVPFWPSSPSSGRLDFGDAWHDDRSGDMHFWDVWHEAKDFEHYRSVQPRFCSEFGFQSLPSSATIRRFTEPGDRNVSSPIMDIHQRNTGGNSRIVETLSRYFRFPDSFDEMLFLSQVAQGMAMQTAVEYWRTQKPHCMGTLYWQLNDTWPVASWSSLEHGGAWKICHSMARRFYAPVLCTAQPDSNTGETVVWAIADCPGGTSLTIGLSIDGFDGSRTRLAHHSVTVPEDRAIEVTRLAAGSIPPQAFLHLQWSATNELHSGENDYFPQRFKTCDLAESQVHGWWRDGVNGRELVLETDAPAFFVTVGLGEQMVYSDNAFTLLPGQPAVIRPLHHANDRNLPIEAVKQVPLIQHLTDASGLLSR